MSIFLSLCKFLKEIIIQIKYNNRIVIIAILTKTILEQKSLLNKIDYEKNFREVMSFDEFCFFRCSKNKHTFMILGLNGEILDILKSRKKAKLLDCISVYLNLKEIGLNT